MGAKPKPSNTRSVKAPEALAALRTWLESLDTSSRQRGEGYFAAHKVIEVWAEADHLVYADVEGSQSDLYEVTLFLTRGRWSSACSCPMDTNCKHAYAAGREWISAVESGAADAAELTPATGLEVLVTPWAASRSPKETPSAKKRSFREEWTPVLAEKLGRPLTDAEGRQLGQLSALFTEFEQSHGLLYPATVRRHGFAELIPHQPQYYEPLYRQWWDPGHPPADPWALWQYLAYDAQREGISLPEVLRPMTNTAGVRAAVEHLLVQQELGVWRRALTGSEPAVRSTLNVAAAIAQLRGRITSEGEFILETRASADKPWKSPGQDWYRSFGNVYPADLEHLTPAEAALGVVLAMECRNRAYSFAAKRPVPREIVVRLLRGAARNAVVLPDERPFAIEAEPLVREAEVMSTASDRLSLRLVRPDGTAADGALLLVSHPEPLYLLANRIWRGPLPLPTRHLPVAALADPHIMTRLRADGLRLPASLALKFRRVILRPKLRCWLDDGTNGFAGENFRVEITADAADVPYVQRWSGNGGWQWLEGKAPPTRGPDDPVLDFDLGTAQAAAARFADFRLVWNNWSEAWERPVTKAFPEDFAAWHASLPAGLEVELSSELAGLLGPPLRARVDFSALPAGSGHDWFDVTVALRVEDSTLTAEETALLLKARGKWVRLPKKGWRRLELAADAAAAAPAALERLGLGATDVLATGKAATHRLHALQLASEAASFEARDARLAAVLRKRAAALAAIPRPEIPAGLRATLRPYQEEGFHFLAQLSANGFGGVLADDMGLGKTVQTLAWLLHLAALAANPGTSFRALVVCPKSVTHGWLAETERFAPGLKAVLYTPALAATAVTALKAELLVANYTQLRLNAPWFQAGAWDAVVLDEGQFIKNPASQVAVAVRALLGRHRLVLTGTPIENRLTDLWSLFAFAQPGLLGAQAAFSRQYPDDLPDAHARLRRRVSHFLLRRTKAQAAPDLPPRTEDDVVVELEGGQRKLYDAELKRARAQLLGVETDRAFDKVRFNVLASLLRLRQICCHPALVDPVHRDLPSAKIEALLERLEELRDEGHQVLVFSQFVEMLEIIRGRVAAAGIGHLMLTGATENRAELVAEFQRDRSKTVFLLSLKAAGFGLNLTAASYAILYDPWWNPAVEAQAIDRTHRIGQTRPVMAYRLLANGTVEQKIRALQQEKSALAAAIVQEESLAKVMDLESLRRILA